MNYEEIFTKYPDMGWIENGEPHFSLSAKINPEATYWVDNAGDVYYYNCKTGAAHDLHPYLSKGYPTIRILGKNYSVSRLVATNFLYQPEGTTDVHHMQRIWRCTMARQLCSWISIPESCSVLLSQQQMQRVKQGAMPLEL